MDEVTRKRLERRLGPDAIRRNLIRASLFLVAFELLTIEVVEKTRDRLGNRCVNELGRAPSAGPCIPSDCSCTRCSPSLR